MGKKSILATLVILLAVMQAFITQPVQLKAAKQYVAHGEYSKSNILLSCF